MDCDAGRDRDGPGAGDVARLELRDQALAAGLGAEEVCAGHDDRELVGADPAQDVRRARETAQVEGERGERGITRLYSAPGVERAEAIDVDDDDADGAPVARGALELARRRAPEGVVDVKARARVPHLALLEARCELFGLRLGLGESQAERLLFSRQQHGVLIGALDRFQ